ncbi:hypothetical protein AALP_AA1G012300 [Arabis alpina]|uniref:Uncharacterized protein n=1 Tax=Arabis alpina TaxID=50452 RepID=A0A087HKB7_ARAAL|nr:hypothetical protein AALP_AA1G012300 [Arabis alpina]
MFVEGFSLCRGKSVLVGVVSGSVRGSIGLVALDRGEDLGVSVSITRLCENRT